VLRLRDGPVEASPPRHPRRSNQGATPEGDGEENAPSARSADTDGFRLPRDQRKGILKGHTQPSARKGIEGSATGELPIRGFCNKPSVRKVYLGRLAFKTSVTDVRSYLCGEGVDLADCLPLKDNKSQGASFYLCLNTIDSEDIVFRSDLWPSGTVIRPFNPPHRPQNKAKEYYPAKSNYNGSGPKHNNDKYHNKPGQYRPRNQNRSGYDHKSKSKPSYYDDYERRPRSWEDQRRSRYH